MKSFITFSVLYLKFSSAIPYSDCVNKDLVIKIPLENQIESNVLKLSSGSCTEDNIPGGIDNAVTYDPEAYELEIKVPISECELDTEYHEPITNITLGKKSENFDVVFKHLHIAGDCQLKTRYAIDFNYTVKQPTGEEEEDGCQMVDDICVFPGNQEDDLTQHIQMVQYTDDTYSVPVEEGTEVKPGQSIYIGITGISTENDYMPPNYDVAVTNCMVIDENGNEHELINPADGNCGMAEIDFQTSTVGDQYRISHVLFLIDNKKEASYTLRCMIELCESTDENSVCKQTASACNGEEVNSSCDASDYVPEDDDVLIGQDSITYESFTQVHSLFVRSDVGAAYLNKFIQNIGTYDYRPVSVQNCITCTGDGFSISTSDNDWMPIMDEEGYSQSCTSETLSYRPKLCPYNYDPNECHSWDWSQMSLGKSSHHDYCGTNDRRTYGLFMKSEIYERLEENCGPFVAVRSVNFRTRGGLSDDVSFTQ